MMELILRHFAALLAGLLIGFILGRVSRRFEFGGIMRGVIVFLLVGLLMYVTISSVRHPPYTPSTLLVGFLAVTIGTYMKPDILEKLLPYIPFLPNGKRAETPGQSPPEGGHRGQKDPRRRPRKRPTRRRGT